MKITVSFEANMTAEGPKGTKTHYVVEDWTLKRTRSAQSKPPGVSRAFPCPNCGGAFETSDSQKCNNCGEVVNNGLFDWVVAGVKVRVDKPRIASLTGTVKEVGTNKPTIREEGVDQDWSGLLVGDPGMTTQVFNDFLRMVYKRLNEGWNGMDLSPVRPYISDSMNHYLEYWIRAYRAQGLRNLLTKGFVTRWQVAKVGKDPFFDTITVRFWASGYDHTIDEATQKVVGGSKTSARAYSEYWTFIRSRKIKGAPKSDGTCPACGAPLSVSTGGNCSHCEAHVTSGDFDWVLSKIEQDESYRG